ncbi:hypothetical protein [Burkholderia vietnamiensis]|uniref:hypothetical protein n=1 Tax=Burkholderia vietnamiensis TaxID=60552 RepID=UPI001B90D9A1|nr:hypothetical protein [Burkholderia vietnamiensis]MBR8055674.1 hypothetical protein [Burkholderia vietnamiensis]
MKIHDEICLIDRANKAACAALLPFIQRNRAKYRIRLIPRKLDDDRPGPVRFSIERRFAFCFWRNVRDAGSLGEAEMLAEQIARRARISRIKPKTYKAFDSEGNEI